MGKLFFVAVAGAIALGAAPLGAQALGQASEREAAASLSGRIDAALGTLPAGVTPAVALRTINAVIRGAEPGVALQAIRDAITANANSSPAIKQALERAIEVARLEIKIEKAIAALGPNPSADAVARAIDAATRNEPAGVVALALDDLTSAHLPGETPVIQMALAGAFSDAQTALANGTATGGIGGASGAGGTTSGGGIGGGASGGGGGSGYGGPA